MKIEKQHPSSSFSYEASLIALLPRISSTSVVEHLYRKLECHIDPCWRNLHCFFFLVACVNDYIILISDLYGKKALYAEFTS